MATAGPPTKWRAKKQKQKREKKILVTMYYVSFVLPHIRANALTLYIFIAVRNVCSLMVNIQHQAPRRTGRFSSMFFFLLFAFLNE